MGARMPKSSLASRMNMNKQTSSQAEKYNYSRDHFRKLAQHKFLAFNEHSNLLITLINELVASITLFVSGKSFREIKNGIYLADLMVSFCRSHFIASELIIGGELVEGAVIVRKQMELLARVNELSAGLDIDRLVKRTPNIKHLKTGLNRLYSEYSKISHSANPKIMQILGRKELEGVTYTPLYPEFQENAYVSMQHLVMTVLEYYVWCANFLIENFPEYDATFDSVLFKQAYEQHQKVFRGAPISELGT
jgi:hypothetical protein